MRNRFFQTAFTPAVQAEQVRHGSRAAYARHSDDQGPERGAALSQDETMFIDARDSFYLATVSETGWPHVQHRGGPVGFVRTLDANTLGWADFAGNRQYVSIGNAAQNEKVALIFVDYPGQARLKVLGRMAWFEAAARPDLAERLISPTYNARVEHLVQIEVEAFDWNCPQHITQRYTLAEISEARAGAD